MIGFKKTVIVTLLASGMLLTWTSQAALYGRGNGMVYDDFLNITIVKDANLFKTQADSNSNLVNNIIDNVGTVTDSIGSHTLTANDFNTNTGTMTWYGAQAWVSNLNYGGLSDWRSPTLQSDNGFYRSYINAGWGSIAHVNQPNSELAFLYGAELKNDFCLSCLSGLYFDYLERGNRVNANFIDAASYTIDSFNNLAVFNDNNGISYWSGSEYASTLGSTALSYSLHWRDSDPNIKSNMNFAWAVRSGDITVVPVPGAIWLFTTCLGLLAFTNRRKTQNIQLQYC